VDEQLHCALCGLLLARSSTPQALTIGRLPDTRHVLVCEDSSACRRRAIELMAAYEKLQR
jgi:hypothetical protein